MKIFPNSTKFNANFAPLQKIYVNKVTKRFGTKLHKCLVGVSFRYKNGELHYCGRKIYMVMVKHKSGRSELGIKDIFKNMISIYLYFQSFKMVDWFSKNYLYYSIIEISSKTYL